MQLRTFYDLLLFRTRANIKTEVSRYYLNYMWWVIDPLITMGTLYLVFGIFMNRGTPNYVPFLLIGITMFQWFARSVNNACGSIIEGRGLMMQVHILKVFFPLEVTLRDSFKNLFATMLLLACVALFPVPINEKWLMLPVLMLVQFILNLGVAMVCAAIVPFVPDLKFIIATGLQLMFFGSGIFYNIRDVVLPKHQSIIFLNPVAGLLDNYRKILMYDTWPDWVYIGNVTLAGMGLILIGYFIVSKFDHIYPRICQQ
ncbi:MAG: ABC transporter permease [Syntrophotalea acetylenica]|nr:ABC transporter permease [Syntrophotalea acetylenica]